MAELTVKTNKDLLKNLGELAKRKLTQEEIDKQRVSFIYAGMPGNSGLSKVDIARQLKTA